MHRCVVFIALFFFPFIGNAQDIFGKWKTIDAVSGEAKSIVEIYERDGKVFGKIIDIINPLDKDALCTKCEGEDYNQPVLGFELIKNLTKDGSYYKNGSIFDPEQGKKYKCRIALDTDNPNVLQVRGYISFLYATQYWLRVES
ncbi:DUF2147 domain-containing protein [Oceanihabitans sp. 2_MG-2023]|uniref:DUF2147 domain-containing protein n=1 Tax=Oceanihabitans sp. 2_MG-2023 TaxID=3062661 RepID=UPI0026E43635|nr:DUF2147 domain-containing protein [Oceanihabitans sp. 2_MG-2023]MDO6596995.1 DUF2147 domain-containing protein [Oceanihabitans sp. 2_MG-2023]